MKGERAGIQLHGAVMIISSLEENAGRREHCSHFLLRIGLRRSACDKIRVI